MKMPRPATSGTGQAARFGQQFNVKRNELEPQQRGPTLCPWAGEKSNFGPHICSKRASNRCDFAGCLGYGTKPGDKGVRNRYFGILSNRVKKSVAFKLIVLFVKG